MSRILLVGKGPPDRGGIAAFLVTLLRSDLRTTHELSLLNLTPEEQAMGGRLTWANITRTARDARALWRSGGHADIIHIHTALVPATTLARAGLLALVARVRSDRVIVHVHSGRVEQWIVSATRRWLTRQCLRPAARVVTVSESSRVALAAAVGQGRVVLVDNGVDLDVYAPPAHQARPPDGAVPRVLYAGLLTPRKGVVDLLTASARLAQRGVQHELLLAGGTPDEGAGDEATVRAAASGAPARFLGAQDHDAMADLYRRCDVFCLASWWEAMPLSVLEAMASGLPVVATSVGDLPRAVVDGVTGRLVPPGDPDALADALASLVGDPALRRRMGSAGRRRAEEQFDTAATVAALDALYAELSARASS